MTLSLVSCTFLNFSVFNLVSLLVLWQFDDIGHHGTKIVIYNLWLNDNGDMELDLNFDVEVPFIIFLLLLVVTLFLSYLPCWLPIINTILQDIRVNADPNLLQTGSLKTSASDHHIANLYRFSLRVILLFTLCI